MIDNRARLFKDKVFINGLVNAILMAREHYREHPRTSTPAEPVDVKEPRVKVKKKTGKKKPATR